MSGIMEKDLPVAESLGSGDKVRIVTSGGNSKQIDAGEIGGGGGGSGTLVCVYDEETSNIDKSYNDLQTALGNGIIPIIVYEHLYLFICNHVYEIIESGVGTVYYADFKYLHPSGTVNLVFSANTTTANMGTADIPIMPD